MIELDEDVASRVQVESPSQLEFVDTTGAKESRIIGSQKCGGLAPDIEPESVGS